MRRGGSLAEFALIQVTKLSWVGWGSLPPQCADARITFLKRGNTVAGKDNNSMRNLIIQIG